MKPSILTVGRQFGSGGRTIAKSVAEQLGIPYYDKEIVEKVALETGFSEEYIEQIGEHARGKSVWSYAFSNPGVPGIMGGMSASDFLWVIQRKVILDLAEKGPCVIVGRCADRILKDREDVLRVFIHASDEFRAERIVRLYGESESKPQKRLADKDAKRRAHYKHYTGEEWGDTTNYHLCLDSGVLGIEKCVEYIVSAMKDE